MPLEVSVEVFGQTQVKRTIMRPSEHAKDARPAFRAVLELFRDIESRRFRAQGPGWAPLNPETLRRKAARGERLQMLMTTGDLFDSLTSPTSGEGISDIDRHSMRYGTRRPWAESHQFGAPDANIPQRKIIDFSEADKRATVKILQRFILTGEVDE